MCSLFSLNTETADKVYLVFGRHAVEYNFDQLIRVKRTLWRVTMNASRGYYYISILISLSNYI